MNTNVTGRLNDRSWLMLIIAISLVVVGVVAFLIYKSQSVTSYDPRIYFLPKLNAFLNASVALLLSAGYYFIRKKNIPVHRACMLAAFTFSIVFLLSYITYHYNAPETKFGGTGVIRGVYLFILLTHIVLAAVIVPMALLTLYRALTNQVAKHRKLARWTFPLWLYVSITGVVVYLMISPYYPV